MDDVTGWELTLQTQGNDLKLSHVLEEIRVEMHGGRGGGGCGETWPRNKTMWL